MPPQVNPTDMPAIQDSSLFLKLIQCTEMPNYTYVLAGIVFGGVGLFLGLEMSSSISGTPSMYGMVAAVYAAVAAAIFAGVKKRDAELALNQT